MSNIRAGEYYADLGHKYSIDWESSFLVLKHSEALKIWRSLQPYLSSDPETLCQLSLNSEVFPSTGRPEGVGGRCYLPLCHASHSHVMSTAAANRLARPRPT